ncbi:precorrin-3B C(17)-methyltransferase [bacterium M00.F.Ca.ET.228.01.1.1]|uniref:precorrin-3B C(17)-methyltransferase n=1 Tax=Paraburkholderia phenoliruptrix TaxID=252970 RepID=UPI0010922161|nr:precorrin-3B C(17)-methyltransferase [Paraburkholderia phenoliruptrix]TGP46458.1 precorrin-3B C(17)-methyltransferase [bacterium M00.F.Ca.ET.228.01.1.1]TGS04319.1 precorrin-3B C(17)-methyltransferase [bacterium M00.F.Ca.ET.191.01.1.1]TGU07751.1 precorrin-3B C(17)-methyltransferase [bacterium M00.F.Ca.ET.155.01.1.1]MBW0446376.1 precorrin-3B C(17)-methyltransferase [Paraburkholderia phenoliruptrix]MBW9096799.1 precorrin-3B C(17)-methyltransferase [Paraburkholderia phenoliruptrix]
MTPPAVVILGAGALATARRIQALYPGSQVHALCERVQAEMVDVAYTELGAHLRELYARGTPIVALCAAGIVIRCVAPLLSNKGAEPPVLAVAEDGSAVVPLLGGLAGVNVMAREIAAALAVAPAITTSGELRFGTCVLNPPPGYALADIGQGKRFVSDLLAGASTRIEGDAPWLDDAQLPRSAGARLAIRITPRAWDGREDELVIHPRSVVAAVILQTGEACSASAIADRVRASLDAHGLATLSLAALLAAPEEMTNAALADAAASLGVPLRFAGRFAGRFAEGLAESEVASRAESQAESEAQSQAESQAQSQAEPRAAQAHMEYSRSPTSLLQAALRIPYETLPGEHEKHGQYDEHDKGVALALSPLAIDPDTIGRARGRLTVIGLGPGSAELMVPAARRALDEATDILGYETYVKMAGPLRADQRVHGTDNREEMQRARHAFELASEGRSVVMVSSGDPGVFAMAAAVLEALDTSGDPAWAAVDLRILPGVSAAMATAAQAGAPLGHDFCMLSLSDNLKPWSIIEQRLRHAAQADLVMAFYNPISRARPWQLDKALDIVREYRAPTTQVVLGRDIGRPGATLRMVTLAELRSTDVDMRTMVIVGSSTTRQFTKGAQWVYTPRWYP